MLASLFVVDIDVQNKLVVPLIDVAFTAAGNTLKKSPVSGADHQCFLLAILFETITFNL